MELGTAARAAIASALATAGVIGVSTALAGSGVGGVFNLGQGNNVNGTTGLSGNTTGAQLQVTNNSSAAQAGGIGITVPSGRPPLIVNRNTRIPNLNADMVDGYHASWFSRAAQGVQTSETQPPTPNTLVTATINVPQPGFVMVTGSTLAFDALSAEACTGCLPTMRVVDDAGHESEPAMAHLGTGSAEHDAAELSMTYIFPTTTLGNHTYSIKTGNAAGSGTGGPPVFRNGVITAVYQPFGYAGAGHGLGPPPAPSARRR